MYLIYLVQNLVHFLTLSIDAVAQILSQRHMPCGTHTCFTKALKLVRYLLTVTVGEAR